jgi:hypothetical protein
MILTEESSTDGLAVSVDARGRLVLGEPMATHMLNALMCCIAALTSCSFVLAAEHHGNVRFGGLPVPGATVTATQGEKCFSTITSEDGVYSFSNLSDGALKIRVEMLLFVPLEQEVVVAANAVMLEWELKLAPVGGVLAAAPADAPSAPVYGRLQPQPDAFQVTATNRNHRPSSCRPVSVPKLRWPYRAIESRPVSAENWTTIDTSLAKSVTYRH